MFLENTVNQKEQFGWIEVICGSMFSGKTEELIRRLRRAQFARQRVEIFKPAIDVRYHDDRVVSHDQNEIRSTPVPAAANIPILADNCDVVGIDEAQFFDKGMQKVEVMHSVKPSVHIPSFEFPVLFMNGSEDYRDSEDTWLGLCKDQERSTLKVYDGGDHFFSHDTRLYKDVVDQLDTFASTCAL